MMRILPLSLMILGISWTQILRAQENNQPAPSLDDKEDSGASLLKDLHLVDQINKKLNDSLPFFYNYSLMGGYFTMPSARMNKSGMVAAGGGRVPPYNIYGLNMQVFDRLELSANYRVYTGITEANFGDEGYGDDAERIGNIKLGILTPSEGFPCLPLISIGADDFIGTKRFNSQYIVVTQPWLDQNFELSIGWGHGRIKGFFGGAAWSPFRKTQSFFRNLSLILEYDANNYKKHPYEHPAGRTVKSRINGGISFLAWDTLQLSVSSVRGEKIAASANLRYPLGTTEGFFPKVDDPIMYKSPVDTEPLGQTRPEAEFAQELAYAFSDQGLDLYTAYLLCDPGHKKELWLKVVNNRYRDHEIVRTRIQDVLAALVPSDITDVVVIIEADGLPCQAYRFRTQDLYRYRMGLIGLFELETLAPMKEAPPQPSEYDAILLFQRRKPIWTFTARPRLISFFGSTSGKFKYNLSAIASPEGYLFDQVYYKMQLSYSIKSNTSGMSGVDRLNPSHMYVVRSDSMKYFQTNTVHLEQAFAQKGWNLGKGFFYRLAMGYFEVAYGGFATELLFFPVRSNFAIGLEFATVWKRHYDGLKFFHKIPKFDGTKTEYKPFTGIQYFLDLYYDFKPLSVDLKITIGQFLAKDKGVRFEVGRYFPSGLRFGIWYAITNANEKLNGHTYHDKGFAFLIPLDMFLKQSSRNYIGYAMSAWLRDQAAQADTGKKLYTTLSEERYLP
jgi:hypothetical protein